MNIFSNIQQSFYNNLIAGNSYLQILSGLKTTLIITIAGLFLGTVLGAALCAMHYSNSKILRFISRSYIIIVRGTPILLLLMLLFYVVFARCRMEAIYVAVIAFGLNGASHIAEIMKAALQSVDPGQVMAARTLGFTKFGAFYHITLPQAGEYARPVYQNAVINIIQWTSVVGYITIADLTRVINSIGARTADPFFLIFTGIIIYLLLAYATHLIFSLAGRKRRAAR
ncbi:MAG TPA: ABC transporter permease subunit [Candidatus Wallbacteria bacterium]|nr:ABC transporter permease subunit [Candidatus Wallbacteria bacterium]